MANFHEIKEKELQTTKDYTKKKFNRYMITHKVLLQLCQSWFYFVSSFIIFMIYPVIFSPDTISFFIVMISHFIYWKLFGEAKHKKDMTILIEELELTIEALKQIKQEKYLS